MCHNEVEVQAEIVPYSTYLLSAENTRTKMPLHAPPPPGEHLGLFCGNQKTQFFASFATNGNNARIKIAQLELTAEYDDGQHDGCHSLGS